MGDLENKNMEKLYEENERLKNENLRLRSILDKLESVVQDDEATQRYKLCLQSISTKDGTVDIPTDAIVVGCYLQQPLYVAGEDGLVRGTIDVICYLKKIDSIKAEKKNGGE